MFPKLPPHLRPLDEELALEQRVVRWWQSLEEGRAVDAYPLLDPSLREAATLDEFLEKAASRKLLSWSVDWVQVDGEKGSARLTTKLTSPQDGTIQERVILDHWIKQEGQWFRTNS